MKVLAELELYYFCTIAVRLRVRIPSLILGVQLAALSFSLDVGRIA
jgi:hypothetical protein